MNLNNFSTGRDSKVIIMVLTVKENIKFHVALELLLSDSKVIVQNQILYIANTITYREKETVDDFQKLRVMT